MQHISHSKTPDYRSLISAFPRDGESRIVSMGHTKADAATLRSILNIYSFRPPEPVIDILVHILESPSPSGALNMFLRIIESGDTPPDEHTLPHAAATVLARTLVGSDALARRVAGDRALLEVSDDGSGFDPGKAKTRLGHGLFNMQTRARNVGGDVDISTEPGAGVTILAWVPYTN